MLRSKIHLGVLRRKPNAYPSNGNEPGYMYAGGEEQEERSSHRLSYASHSSKYWNLECIESSHE